MAGSSVTFTERANKSASVKKIKAVWVSDDSAGTASGTTTNVYDGKVELLTTVPAAAGAAPTDNYDVTLLDDDSVDVLGGGGADRDTANAEQKLSANLGIVAGSKLTLSIANAGNSKGGTVYVYIR